MELESYEHAREDLAQHRLIDLRNQARLDIRQIRKQLEKVGDEADGDYRTAVEQHIQTVEDFVNAEGPDGDAFANALTAMDHATIQLAELAIAKTLRDEGIDLPTVGGESKG